MIKKRKSHKKILYLKWLEDNKAEAEIEEISERVCVDKDKVIVKKESFASKVFVYFVNGIIVLIKTIFVLALMALISLAVTVLINPTLRDFVFTSLFN